MNPPPHELFNELIKGIYESLSMEFSDSMSDENQSRLFEFEIEEVPMSLIYDPESDAQHIFIYCLMGAVPREKEAQALRRLLEINFLTYQHSAPMMGIDPETGQVFFAFQANLGAINPMLALDTMEMAAKQVQKWRQTYFLEETFDLTSHNQPVSFV